MCQFVESSKRRTHSHVLGVGECLHHIILNSLFDDKLIENVAKFIKKNNPTLKRFNKSSLYRMKQFYETHVNDEFVSPVVTQIS